MPTRSGAPTRNTPKAVGVFFISFPKLAQRFGNARPGETLSALQANDGLGRAPEALPPATEMEFRL